jgi:hypothetical protein
MKRGKQKKVKRVTKEEEAARVVQLQKQKEQELIDKALELGLGFNEQDLPAEEVEEDAIKRTHAHSFLAMVPYTKEWYEGQIAEDEFDNLAQIKFEKVKAEALLQMTRIGKHEEAMSIMRAETKNDFFYFNRLKTKFEGEGKYSYEPPPVDKSRKERSMLNLFARAIGESCIA